MNRQVLDGIASNKYIVYLKNTGVDVGEITNCILDSLNEDVFDEFVNRSHQLLSPNVYLECVVFKIVCEHFNRYYTGPMDFENEINIDVKTIIATSQSVIQRPKIQKPSEVIEGFREPDYDGDFRVISRFERELSDNRYGVREKGTGGVILEGLLPYEIEINPLLEKSPSNNIWTDSYCRGMPYIQGFNSSINSIEAQFVLWMNSELLTILGLRVDIYKSGLRALNSNNEIVLNFRCWRDNLIGNGSSFVGINSNISKLEGCDLILRDDYFDRLKNVIPQLVYYSKVIRYD